MHYKSQFDRIYPILLYNWYVFLAKIAIFIGLTPIYMKLFSKHPII